MKALRATPEQLEAFMMKVSVRAERSFQLQCKFCRDLGIISAGKHNFSDLKASWKAAVAFAEQGWWFDGVPICPKCYRRKKWRAMQANH